MNTNETVKQIQEILSKNNMDQLLKKNNYKEAEAILKNINNVFKQVDWKEVASESPYHPLEEYLMIYEEYQKQLLLEKPLGLFNKNNFEEANKNNFDMSEKFVEELETINFKDLDECQEFFKFMSCHNSNTYSYRNRMIQFAQIKENNYIPVVASMKEWNKKHVVVMTRDINPIVLEITSKQDTYYNSEPFNPVPLKNTWDKEEIQARDDMVRKGKLLKHSHINYDYIPCLYSASQTYLSNFSKDKLVDDFYNAGVNVVNLEKHFKKTKELLKKLKEFEKDTNYEINNNNFFFKSLFDYSNEICNCLFHRHPEINGEVNNENRPYYFDFALKTAAELEESKKKFILSDEQQLIQRELFTRLFLEGIGMETKYLGDIEGNFTVRLKDIPEDMLNAHLQIVHKQAVEVSKMIVNDQINEKNLEKLKNFMPDRYYLNDYNQSIVIPNEQIKTYHTELTAKIVNKAIDYINSSKMNNDLKQHHLNNIKKDYPDFFKDAPKNERFM